MDMLILFAAIYVATCALEAYVKRRRCNRRRGSFLPTWFWNDLMSR